MATRKTQMRLAEDDRRRIAAIRARYGLDSDTDAVRLALNELYRAILREPVAIKPARREQPAAN